MDIERLRNLLGNDENMVERFLDIFQNQVPQELANLENAIADENWNAVSNIAHGIKSQVNYLDLNQIADLAYEIERNAEFEENLGEMSSLFRDLNSELSAVISGL